MPEKTQNYFEQLNRASRVRHRLRRAVTVLSFAVIFAVFWSLKLTGIGIAGEAFCGQQEHVHDETCGQKTLVCTLEETQGHTHSESCLCKELICPLAEGEPEPAAESAAVPGSEASAESEPAAAPEEGVPEESEPTAAPEGEIPTEETSAEGGAAAEGEPIPEEEPTAESEAPVLHVHTDACWRIVCGFGCGQTEAEGHTHTPACLAEETQTDCGQDTDGHVHTESCYAPEGGCTLEEHIHTESCYSDITADIETYDDWEAPLLDMVRGPTIRENVVLIAQSQLGYTESTLNFQVDANGVRRGITRYGQWYGTPYGDWSAMFVCFCLDYGGAVDVPMNAGPEAMRLEWEKAELYVPVELATPEEFEPMAGELLFLHKGENPLAGATAVAIVTAVDETGFAVIEGDLDNTVAETRYEREDPAILGFGMMPADSFFGMEEPSLFATNYTVWLDGTDGGMAHLTGSPNTKYTVQGGSTMQLPSEWTSPNKYSYRLRGWYDVTNSRYYPPGGEIEINGNTVLYADWVATTYDIGIFNAQVADTVSTNSFITTHVFDYNYLFNVQSTNAKVTASATSHSETWSMLTTGDVDFRGEPTIDFIFGESDGGGTLSNPNNRSSRNTYRNADTISSGICTPEMVELLYSPKNAFDPATGEGVIGKTYLGTGDHLFQIMNDPEDEHYGYYYYDSLYNAISYNQSNNRFYVYEYLSATADAMGGSNADFLPLNSPYANTNGKTVPTYTYAGVNGAYPGVQHYRFDTEQSGGSYNSTNNVNSEFAYGMRSDIRFYLPNDPGTGGNKDLNGNEIEFSFSGDDDLWVLIDGVLVLDIGGIHQRIAGNINFSTGAVTVNNKAAPSLQDLGIGDGDHTMTVLYLERGASMSNCSIWFNLVPRFGMQIQKEDVLTQQLLDGTQFTVYQDFACTAPAELWESEAAYMQDSADGKLDEFQSTFTVKNGVATLWGFGSGNTYYIKETGPPAVQGYGTAQGVIRMTIEKGGLATYSVDVVEDAQGNKPSNGFTVHGVRIDETTQTVYIVVTNAPEAVTEITTVQVIKKWEDQKDHSKDYIQAYLTVTDPDGTVRRIREVTLGEENEWMYLWTNLPKYDYNALTEVQYGVEESYESGYYSTVRKITQIEITTTHWGEVTNFVGGESCILKGDSGYLSTNKDGNNDVRLIWVDEETAKTSPRATWTVTVSGDKVRFTNGANQILTFVYSSSSSRRYFYATTSTNVANGVQTLTPDDTDILTGFRFFARRYNSSSGTTYYMSDAGINSSGRIPTATKSSDGLILTPMKEVTVTDVQAVKDWAYQITNTPLEANNETSLTVNKEWQLPAGMSETAYQEYAVTIKLLANGVDTGRSVTLTLKNNWTGTFQGLPYKDANGNIIQYTVKETWMREGWTPYVTESSTAAGNPPTYKVTVTNVFHQGGPILPSTGSCARLMYYLCGSGIILGTLVYSIGLRRKRERRTS